MIAYCFATTQTAEGSIKKGILRMIGTILGVSSTDFEQPACLFFDILLTLSALLCNYSLLVAGLHYLPVKMLASGQD